MQVETYTDRLKTLIQTAQSLALRNGHQQITPLHVFKAFLELRCVLRELLSTIRSERQQQGRA